jgi:hypothetical protein
VFAGDHILSATAGDFVVVPPGNAHAFAATVDHSADVLVMVTPGVERFPFFRAMSSALQSGADRAAASGLQAALDTYPSESAEWSSR